MIYIEAYNLYKSLEAEICRKNTSLLDKYPVERYCYYLENYPQMVSYNFVSPDVELFCEKILQHADLDTMETYHKLLQAKLLYDARDKLSGEKYPNDVKEVYVQDFRRILNNIKNLNNTGTHLYQYDSFHKNLAICCLRLIPVGARKVCLAKLPIKKFMFKKGISQLIDLIFYIIVELRGIEPLYISHLDTNDPNLVAELNPEGLKRAYLRIAELLKMNQNVKGLFGTSWLLDPQLQYISPRHSYNRLFFLKNGCKLYYQGSNKEAVKNATLTSKTRRKFYEEGAVYTERTITQPIEATVLVGKNGILQTSGVDYNMTDGQIVFISALSASDSISAGFEFDVPCRFDTDELVTNLNAYHVGNIVVPVIEVRM